MTDEEFGRTWAGQMDRKPNPPGIVPSWEWWWSATGDGRIPLCVWNELRGAGSNMRSFPTEADAFAALGRAVRMVHREVPHLREDEK